MAIAISGRIIKVKSKKDLEEKEPRHWYSLDYSHIRVTFEDNSFRHFLFSNSQVKRAMSTGKKNKDKLPSISWVKEFWYKNVIDLSKEDIEKDIKEKQLPTLAKRYNHIRVELDGTEVHLLFSLKDVQKAYERAAEIKKLPKLSWVIK